MFFWNSLAFLMIQWMLAIWFLVLPPFWNPAWTSGSSRKRQRMFKVKVKVAQSCATLCDPMDYIVHGILQARILEWVAFPLNYHTIALIWHASKVMLKILQASFQQYVNQVVIQLATKWLPKAVNKCFCTSFLSLYPIRDM